MEPTASTGESTQPDYDIDRILLKDFDLEQNEHFIKFVFIPYFKDIYNDLANKSDKKSKGINKLVFTEVSTLIVTKSFSMRISLAF
jgi:hypothetical protein